MSKNLKLIAFITIFVFFMSSTNLSYAAAKVSVQLEIDGVVSTQYFKAGTNILEVKDHIETKNKKKYISEDDLEQLISVDEKYTFYEVKEEIHSQIIDIPFETIVIEIDLPDFNLDKVGQEGISGQKEVVLKTVTSNNGILYEEIVSEVITAEPVDQIILRGTSNTIETERGRVGFTQELSMLSYAYTGGGRTASGHSVRRGLIAVDPRVIPLGTKLYVEGYGFALASDTGGMIKGNVIDVYVPTRDEAAKFGKRNLKVYVLADQSIEI